MSAAGPGAPPPGSSVHGRRWADRRYWSVRVHESSPAQLTVELVAVVWRGRVPYEVWRESCSLARMGSGDLGADEVLEAVSTACLNMIPA